MSDKPITFKNKYLMYLTAFYITIKLTAFIMTYKVTDLHIFEVCFAVFLIPVWFLTGDIIAEIYGYKIAKQLIWTVIICQTIMILLCYASSKTLSPPDFSHQSKNYEEVLNTLTRGAITNAIGIIIGGLVNARIIILLKLMFNGKYFIIRCLIASLIGELVFTVIAYSAGFFEISSANIVFKLMAASYAIKLIASPLLVIPAAIISKKLKKLETNAANSNEHSGIIKKFNNQFDFFNISSDTTGKSYLNKQLLDMPITHELGKFSVDYKNSNIKFAEFKPGVSFGYHNVKNHQIYFCINGKIRITTSSGDSKIFIKGDVLFLNDLTGDGHMIETLSSSKLMIIDLS